MKPLAEQLSPLHRLALYGGFVFFDATLAVVAVEALKDGTDVFFNFPLGRNIQIRQYKLKDETLKYGLFPLDEEVYTTRQQVAFCPPQVWTPDDTSVDADGTSVLDTVQRQGLVFR